MASQLNLPLHISDAASDQRALWSPRDLWLKFDQQLLTSLNEDRRIEFKATPKLNFDTLAQYLSAFSNTPEGGILCIGVSDNGLPTGCENLNSEQLDRLENFFLTYCPLAKPEFKRVPVQCGGKADFVLLIYCPYVGKLVETNKGEAFTRYGSSIHKMSDDEKRDYRATRNEISFELELSQYIYPDDFDREIIQQFCDNFREREDRYIWTNEQILTDRRLLAYREAEGHAPLNSLVLLAAKDPSKSIPGCRVRVQRFDSTTEGSGENYSPIRDRFIEGNLVKIITEADKLIQSTLHDVTWLNKEGKFLTSPEYPRWAWFEALVNACVHRSYSFSGTDISVKIFTDRMIIESPGGFVPPVSERTIYDVRASRNHHTMDALRYLGYVQMAREGTRRMRESMIAQNLPEPKFSQEMIHGLVVRVTLRNDHAARKRSSDSDVAHFFGPQVWKLLQEHEMKIAAYAYRNEAVQVSEAQRLTGRTWSTSKKDLDRLVRKGILEFNPGKFARDPKAHYALKRTPSTIDD